MRLWRMPLRNISIIMSNTFGKLFTLTTFGESHGVAIGGVVDGMPAGIDVDLDFIQNELATPKTRTKPYLRRTERNLIR